MENRSELKAAVENARSRAKEDISAACQRRLDSVRRELEASWQTDIDRALEERFQEVEQRLEALLEETSRHAALEAEEKAAQIRATAQRSLTDRLNSSFRRLRQAGNDGEWSAMLLNAASEFSPKTAVIRVQGNQLRLQGSQPQGAAGVETTLELAPAFAQAVETKETVVTAVAPAEISAAIAQALGTTAPRAYLFPVAVRQKIVAILYAEPELDQLDVSALELLSAMAGIPREQDQVEPEPAPPGLIQIGMAPVEAPAPPVAAQAKETPQKPRPAAWNDLSREERETHLRAQRFARTRVAGLLLHHVARVREGRTRRDLYGALREEIDTGRQEFRQQFFERCPSMVDYYHLELVHSLAQDAPEALGAAYPGPLS